MGRIGGHCNMTNIDKGALSYIIMAFPVRTMVDVGCGPGGMVRVARSLGLEAYGIDGDPSVNPDLLHNFEHGHLEVSPCDLAWSVEFLEHIEEDCLDYVFGVFDRCSYVFCTHNARPGPWHCNCKSNDYWIEQFSKRDFLYEPCITSDIKYESTMAREFVKDSGTFFLNLHRR